MRDRRSTLSTTKHKLVIAGHSLGRRDNLVSNSLIGVLITDVTIDHIAKEVAHDLRTTPRQMEVWGLLEGRENREKYVEFEAQRDQARADDADIPDAPEYPSDLPRSRDVRYVPIASFMYDIHASNNIQTFPVRQDIQDLGIDFGVVVLVVKSNWGSQSFTCLYRFRFTGTAHKRSPRLILN